MPYITVESGALSDEQKEELIKRLTEVSSEIMKVPQEFFVTTIKEVSDKADERIENQTPDDWERLYAAAKNVINPREISPFIEAGGVGAAIMTKEGNIYTGVCIDTASTLGMCGERNAIANMITNGESRIAKVVAIGPDGKVGSPCGACREYMMQLDKNSGDIEILLDLETRKTITLKELIPDWWGTSRFEETL